MYLHYANVRFLLLLLTVLFRMIGPSRNIVPFQNWYVHMQSSTSQGKLEQPQVIYTLCSCMTTVPPQILECAQKMRDEEGKLKHASSLLVLAACDRMCPINVESIAAVFCSKF